VAASKFRVAVQRIMAAAAAAVSSVGWAGYDKNNIAHPA